MVFFCQEEGVGSNLKYFCEIPIKVAPNSLLSIIDNFVIASPEQLGILVPDSIKQKFITSFFYTHEKWKQLYLDLCVKKSKSKLRKRTLLIFLCSIKFSALNIKHLAKQKVKTILKR